MNSSVKLNVLTLAIDVEEMYHMKHSVLLNSLRTVEWKHDVLTAHLRTLNAIHADVRGMIRSVAEQLTVEEFQLLTEWATDMYEAHVHKAEAEYKYAVLIR